ITAAACTSIRRRPVSSACGSALRSSRPAARSPPACRAAPRDSGMEAHRGRSDDPSSPLRDEQHPPTPNDDPIGAPPALERRDQIRAKRSAQLLGNHAEEIAERARLCELDEGLSALVTAHGRRDVELDELESTLE